MAIKTYPLNDIDYQAEDAELFHCTRISGVYASGHFPVSVTGTDNNITIGKGIGWLKNTEFSGKVFASKEETTLNAGVPDASLPRVDAVAVRFDANQNETYFTIKQGSTGSTPTPPEIERGEYIYELHLYHIRRRPGATAITPGDITDLRMDANYCGLMADSVTQVDMSAINAQVREFISDWENQIANVTDGKMIESPEYPGCYYRMNWGVKEWLNPPMMEDVEYPTTKRQDGKRVYTKLLKARSQAGFVSLPDIERIVSVFAVAERDWNGEKIMFQLPVDFLPEDSPTIQKMQIYYRGNNIVFQSVVAKGTYNLYITVEYTKPGDEVAYTNVTADGDTLNVETNGDVSAQGDNLNVEMFTTVSTDGGAYIRKLTINGVAYDLAVGQAGSGAPGTAYPGVPGQFYTDLDSGEVYVCMGGSADAGIYIWRTIIPSRLPVRTIQINHKTGIGSATITATQGAIIVENGGENAILHGIANPVNDNDAVNKKYVDSKVISGGTGPLYIATDYGISADAEDNTPAMQALIDQVSAAGGGVVWFPVGTYSFKRCSEQYDKDGYLIDYAVRLESNVSIVGENRVGTVLRQTEGVPYALFLRMATADEPLTGCTFADFTIDAYDTGYTNQVYGKAFYCQYLRDCVFRDLRLCGTVATALGIDYLDRVAIDRVDTIDCGRTWTGTQGGSSGIGIGTGGWEHENFVISNCVCVGSGQFGIFIENQYNLGWGGSQAYAKGCIISGCIVRGGLNHGIGIRGGQNVTIIGCESYENAAHGVYLDGKCRNIHIQSVGSEDNGGCGVRLNPDAESEGITVRGCSLVGNVSDGIRVSAASSGLCIQGNNTRGNSHGLYIKDGLVLHDCAIWGNVCLDGAESDATFTGNTDYINELSAPSVPDATRIELTGDDLLQGVKLMPDGSETTEDMAQTTDYLDVSGMGGSVTISVTGTTEAVRVAQYDADKASLVTAAGLTSIAGTTTQSLTITKLDGCVYIRMFFTKRNEPLEAATIQSIVIEPTD